MHMENGYDKFYYCCAVNLWAWGILVTQRDSLNLIMLAGFFNLHDLSLVYITGQVGEMQDPDRAFTLHLQMFLVMDLVSSYLQTLATKELSFAKIVSWNMTGKFAVLFYLLLNYDDRQSLIAFYFVVSVFTCLF